MRAIPPNKAEKSTAPGSNSAGIRLFDREIALRDLGLPDHITVLSKISQGGMGVVLKGLHKSTGRYLAIKLLLPKQVAEKTDIVRFKREAQAIASLSSKHIVKLHDFGSTSAGIPFLAMEFVNGVTLAELIQIRKLTFDEVVQIIRQTSQALAHAHTHGIVHRDLKPTNIMVTVDSNDEVQVKVVDFGIAKIIAGHEDETLVNVTHGGELVGTPAFMSPEQSLGGDVDLRSDIYSLGCVMHFLMAGQAPLTGTTNQILASHANKEVVPPIRALRKDVPKVLELLVEKMLEPNPDERYQDMHEVTEALDGYTSGDTKAIAVITGRQRRQVFRVLKLLVIVAIAFIFGWAIMTLLGRFLPPT